MAPFDADSSPSRRLPPPGREVRSHICGWHDHPAFRGVRAAQQLRRQQSPPRLRARRRALSSACGSTVRVRRQDLGALGDAGGTLCRGVLYLGGEAAGRRCTARLLASRRGMAAVQCRLCWKGELAEPAGRQGLPRRSLAAAPLLDTADLRDTRATEWQCGEQSAEAGIKLECAVNVARSRKLPAYVSGSWWCTRARRTFKSGDFTFNGSTFSFIASILNDGRRVLRAAGVSALSSHLRPLS